MNAEKEITKRSKFLSLVLRHRPNLIGITLDNQGWISVEILLEKLEAFGNPLTSEELDFVVQSNNKKRFSFSEDKTMIRASQGHSIDIDLGYKSLQPPEILYHGTAKIYVDSILRQGIRKRKRHHVHLSSDKITAKSVGSRHGSPVILKIQSTIMHQAGIEFFLSKNNVWLTDYVDPKYILPE
ncbi:MAG: putative RNA 2'-phosphotransferase [Saprospiraceae bacterium]|jgi:putative RNA 2'-phosphotransferase